eukprot:COSAG02_NODE_2084_length_9892_cov_47.719085_3_plen_148_part_00
MTQSLVHTRTTSTVVHTPFKCNTSLKASYHDASMLVLLCHNHMNPKKRKTARTNAGATRSLPEAEVGEGGGGASQPVTSSWIDMVRLMSGTIPAAMVAASPAGIPPSTRAVVRHACHKNIGHAHTSEHTSGSGLQKKLGAPRPCSSL